MGYVRITALKSRNDHSFEMAVAQGPFTDAWGCRVWIGDGAGGSAIGAAATAVISGPVVRTGRAKEPEIFRMRSLIADATPGTLPISHSYQVRPPACR